MSVRKYTIRLGLATAAIAGLGLSTMGPALADAGPSSPVLGTDVVGVGSDTTQWVMDQLTTDYDASHTTGPQLVNYDACLGNTSTGAPGLGDNPDGSGFPCGADHSGTKAGVARSESIVDPSATGALPNGSGSGRTLLRTPSDGLFNDVAFGRSSGPINTTDISAGEIALPFAVDKIVVATNPTGPAPASLTGPQILKIYDGTYNNWDQVGGSDAPIHIYLPKSGSSTLNAFESFLAGLDGTTEAPGTDNDPASHSAAKQTWQGPGSTITDSNWNTGTVNVEEHDPSVVLADADAIEPFSYGRAQLANKNATSVRIEGGWSADRELYNVVRNQPITGATSTPFLYGATNSPLPGIFGNTGWICTDPAAQTDIGNAGFWPLSSSLCGKPNTSTFDTINAYASNGVGEGASTTTSAQLVGRSVDVAVQTSGDTTPTGTVQITVATPAVPGQTAPAASYTTTAPLDANGDATFALPSKVSGKQTVDVAYLPTDFGTLSSAGGHSMKGSSYAEFTATVASAPVTKAKVKLKATKFPKTTSKGKNVTGTITATAETGKTKPTGSVEILLGSKVIEKIKLSAGVAKAKFAATKLKAKKSNKLTIKYLPTGNFVADGTTTVTIKRTK